MPANAPKSAMRRSDYNRSYSLACTFMQYGTTLRSLQTRDGVTHLYAIARAMSIEISGASKHLRCDERRNVSRPRPGARGGAYARSRD